MIEPGDNFGWAVYSGKQKYRYNFGVYDYETGVVPSLAT